MVAVEVEEYDVTVDVELEMVVTTLVLVVVLPPGMPSGRVSAAIRATMTSATVPNASVVPIGLHLSEGGLRY